MTQEHIRLEIGDKVAQVDQIIQVPGRACCFWQLVVDVVVPWKSHLNMDIWMKFEKKHVSGKMASCLGILGIGVPKGV